MENFDTKKLISLFKNNCLINEIVYVNETDSTNNLAKKEHKMADKTLFIADIQTAGRGRNGRKWISDNNSGLWMSLLLKPEINSERLSLLTLISGIAVVRAVKKQFNADVYIKWPNDVIYNNKKLCGILCEGGFEGDKLNYAVCGMGINLNTDVFDEDIENIACSLKSITGENISREEMCAEILNCFFPLYSEFLQNGFKNLVDEYKKYCITLNKEVLIVKGDKKQKAYAFDIDNNGNLLVKTDNGIEILSSGEVSVRGLLEYV